MWIYTKIRRIRWEWCYDGQSLTSYNPGAVGEMGTRETAALKVYTRGHIGYMRRF